MKLLQLLQNVGYKEIIGNADVEISGLCADSRKVTDGDLFFCYEGGQNDSHLFIDEAVKAGAAAVICERDLNCKIPQIIVDDGRGAVALVARAFYGFADKKLKLVEVTGTT